MCYDTAYLAKRSLDYARRVGYGAATIAELQERFAHLQKAQGPTWHASGFAHPALPVLTNLEPELPHLFHWGLIPFWVKNSSEAYRLHHQTLNARCETIFSKPAYRAAARYRRCLVILDGFFEHHHLNRGTQPYYIQLRSGEPMVVAGIWEQWQDEYERTLFSVSIVTTRANALMARIHNNPKLAEARMPVLLAPGEEQHWLQPELSEKEAAPLWEPYDADEMQAHPVAPIRGGKARGNCPEAQAPVDTQTTGSLF